jgi:hypothetical protein
MDEANEPVEVLSVGAIMGGMVTSDVWEQAVHEVRKSVKVLRAGKDSPIAVNVIFQIPGEVLQPDFSGVRTGYYSKKDRHLIVQVAIPETAPGDARAEIVFYMRQAVEAAEAFAIRRKLVAGPLATLRQITAQL